MYVTQVLLSFFFSCVCFFYFAVVCCICTVLINANRGFSLHCRPHFAIFPIVSSLFYLSLALSLLLFFSLSLSCLSRFSNIIIQVWQVLFFHFTSNTTDSIKQHKSIRFPSSVFFLLLFSLAVCRLNVLYSYGIQKKTVLIFSSNTIEKIKWRKKIEGKKNRNQSHPNHFRWSALNCTSQ